MTSAPWLEPVRAALDAADEPVAFFFRDDDAGWADDHLMALLDLFDEHGVCVDLAVIPAALRPGLAAELRARRRAARAGVGLHQHGLAHVNHETEGKRQEFGPARGPSDQRGDLAAGRERLAALLGDDLDPIFTPPWNRCTEVTGRCLADLGVGVLSRDRGAGPLAVDGLRELGIDADWVRLERAELGARVAARVRAGGPVGVMLHHAEMDAAGRADLGELLRLVADHRAAVARPMLEVA
jgi:peptidoglycan/xylan/chitin deacetylase (PgdA/CDA1 family)